MTIFWKMNVQCLKQFVNNLNVMKSSKIRVLSFYYFVYKTCQKYFTTYRSGNAVMVLTNFGRDPLLRVNLLIQLVLINILKLLDEVVGCESSRDFILRPVA